MNEHTNRRTKHEKNIKETSPPKRVILKTCFKHVFGMFKVFLSARHTGDWEHHEAKLTCGPEGAFEPPRGFSCVPNCKSSSLALGEACLWLDTVKPFFR